MAEVTIPEILSDEEAEDWEIEHDQYIIFTVDGRFFGFKAMRIMEIAAVIPTTEVPNAPPWIDGIMNLRGTLTSVINFRKKFGFSNHAHDEDTRTIIVEKEDYSIGVIVDSVEEVMKIPDESLQALPKEAESFKSEHYISKIGMIDDRFIIILDIDTVLEDVEVKDLNSFQDTVETVINMDFGKNGTVSPSEISEVTEIKTKDETDTEDKTRKESE